MFTAHDRGNRIVTDLRSEQLRLIVDGTQREIAWFAGDAPLPLRIVLLLDRSNSQRDRRAGAELEPSIKLFQRVLRNGDLAMVATFDNAPHLIQDFSDDQKVLAQAMTLATRVRFGGATALSNALLWATQEKLSSQSGRRAIVLVSDGEDTLRQKPITDVLDAAQRASTAIYVVWLGAEFGSPAARSRMLDIRPDFISREIPEQTGGWTFPVRDDGEMERAFENIADELRHFYVLGFSPPENTNDGKFHKITLESTRKNLKLSVQKGYYMPRR